MKTYRVYQIDAFTGTLFKGNPAGVVANADGLTDSQMQAIARELNNAETAFILSPTGPDHDVWVRFFTPATEVPICGHATISAHYVRALELGLDPCTVMQKVGVGILPVDIIKAGHGYEIIMTQGEFELSGPLDGIQVDELLTALGLKRGDLDESCPVEIASTGHSKVMIGINSRAALNALKPDMNRLAGLSSEIGCNGYFVFTFDSDSKDILTHGRMFAPAIGINEDPVTGNANGPLGGYLVAHGLLDTQRGEVNFKGKQGEAMGRPGVVSVTVEAASGKPTRIKVGGKAVTAFRTEITL